MNIKANHLYHIYNQGNNDECIFFERLDYIHFITKFRVCVLPHCEVVNYCLMPTYFRFLIYATAKSTKTVQLGRVESTELGNGFRLLCSGYANDFNKKYQRTGSLFRQKTKAKYMETKSDDSQTGVTQAKNTYTFNYPQLCFHYIHQSPMVAGLCKKMEEWEFSSFRDYLNLRKGTLITKDLAFSMAGVDKDNFYKESYQLISGENIQGLFDD